MTASRASRRAISAGMSHSGSFFSASSACSARLSRASICAFSSASDLSMWPSLIALWRLALALSLVPSTAMVPSLTRPISRARRTTCTNRSLSSLGWNARKSRRVRCAGKLPAASTRKATSSFSFPGNLARAEHTRGVPVHQHLDHHGRVKRLVAWAILVVACMERRQIHRVADEVRQMKCARCPSGSQSWLASGSSSIC